MRILAKLLFNIRYLIPQRLWELYFSSKYFLSVFLGWLKGLTYLLRGRVLMEDSYRPFLIGKVSVQMEKGSNITLSKRKNEMIKGSNWETILKEVSAIGLRVDWRFMNPPLNNKSILRLQKNARIIIGPNVSIMPGAYLSVWPNQELIIEEDVGIGSEIYITTKCSLRIKKGAIIGHQVFIMDYDGHPANRNKTTELSNVYGGNSAPITIEEKAWIGFRSTILKGVTIGTGAIVGANSCVTKNVPPYSLVAGNPAQIITEDIQWVRY